MSIKQSNLVTNADFNNELSIIDNKITANKTKNLASEKELKKIECI